MTGLVIEPKPTVMMYRIARSLKLKREYETVLVTLSKIDKEFYSEAYDKLLILELSHKVDRKVFKTLLDFFRKVLSRKGRNFLKEVKEMKPYMFSITGPDLFSLMLMSFLNKSPRIYYANDLWSRDFRNFFFTKEFWIKGEVQKFCEKICFKMVDGIINKKSIKDFELFKHNIKVPKMGLFPNCLDDWIFPPKKKKDKEIHIVFGGSPQTIWKGENRYIKAIKEITAQKIYFHTYGRVADREDDMFFTKESKDNKYYCLHERVKPNELNKEMSRYTYGIFPPFEDLDENLLNEQKLLMAGKMVNYLEAGLPVIMDKECTHMINNITDKHGVGFNVGTEDLKNLRKILEKKDYKTLQRNIKKFQEEFKWSKKIKEIENFYEKIISAKD